MRARGGENALSAACESLLGCTVTHEPWGRRSMRSYYFHLIAPCGVHWVSSFNFIASATNGQCFLDSIPYRRSSGRFQGSPESERLGTRVYNRSVSIAIFPIGG